jgi:hypothetical protein
MSLFEPLAVERKNRRLAEESIVIGRAFKEELGRA